MSKDKSNGITINYDAPVIAESQIEITASPESVWDIMIDIGHWPDWNHDVKKVFLNGAIAEGSEFRWQAGPGIITSIMQRIEKPRLLAWTGKTFGIRAVHVWRIERNEGKTIVKTEESWEGFPARMMRRPMQKTLNKSIEAGLRYLKTEAERRSTL